MPALHMMPDLGYSMERPPGVVVPPQVLAGAPTVDRPTAHGVLGDYRILREIGRGGMAAVYEADQISLGRRVALKVLPFAAVLDSKQLRRFQNEARAAAHLHHQNIVPVYSVGSERGVHYYAMQYIEGQTLAEVIRTLRYDAGLEEKGIDHPPIGDSGQRAPMIVSTERVPVTVHRLPADGSASTHAHPTKRSGDRPLSVTTPIAGLSSERSTNSREFFRTIARLGVQAAEALDHAHTHWGSCTATSSRGI